MRNLYKNIVKTLLVSTPFLLTGCIEETEPMNGTATAGQIQGNAQASEALVNALPATFNDIFLRGEHYSFGYGGIMHIRDVMTGDMATVQSNYDSFDAFARVRGMGPRYVYMQYVWNYYTGFILSANNIIKNINETSANDPQKGQLGLGYAFRALCYLDMARMFEFLPNEKFPSGKNAEGVDVTNLTVPIVTEKTTIEESRKNPRVTREKMFEFIKSDLNKAETLIPNYKSSNKAMPNLACVYGLKARLYMWVEKYDSAQIYARKAIDASNLTPMTKEQSLDTKTGFNQATPWMWASSQTADDATVKSKLINWTSYLSNETEWGYTSYGGPVIMISRDMYDRLSDTDWRKLEFKAPDGSALADKNTYCDDQFKTGGDQELPKYASLKFRPGNGDVKNNTVGAATSFPIMRVEEMYFIEAEAAAHQNPTHGKTLLVNFMRAYRDANYSTTASTKDAVVEEIVFQKRVELWGEGQTFYDIKRLNYSVKRAYTGTNFKETARYNTNGRPAWMNFCIIRNEGNNNDVLLTTNNPDPSGLYEPVR
ncbi:RagB/SusD family nutrient uptake outer membrane protein [Prevotella salivae]|uniref:RagB/SusD family nutrient uptake outer membrane protein n=1 Tax=Segatella salivae TaxID=228604 RepID=UPI001C5D6909|nr:RagB/SusD family nutrient uptake outer membrane protein [Segatella salivae]MBW4764957.1 RagB/SusD family nutrient uptake outer membrane protein [Segatella salivae]